MSVDHRQLAVDLFNHVWTLLGKSERTPEEDDEMIHAAHASRRHWSEVGKPDELEEWDLPYAYEALARANSIAGNVEESKRFAARARELGEQIQDDEDREHLNGDLATLP